MDKKASARGYLDRAIRISFDRDGKNDPGRTVRGKEGG